MAVVLNNSLQSNQYIANVSLHLLAWCNEQVKPDYIAPKIKIRCNQPVQSYCMIYCEDFETCYGFSADEDPE